MTKAPFLIKVASTKAASITIGDKIHSIDLTNSDVLKNLIETGIRTKLHASMAGKEGKDRLEKLTAQATALSKGLLGRASFDLASFNVEISEAESLADLVDLLGRVKNAPKKDQGTLAGTVQARMGKLIADKV